MLFCMARLAENAGKVVEEDLSATRTEAYDKAEQYMTDNEAPIMKDYSLFQVNITDFKTTAKSQKFRC